MTRMTIFFLQGVASLNGILHILLDPLSTQNKNKNNLKAWKYWLPELSTGSFTTIGVRHLASKFVSLS
jgi:hypothetical protein